MRHSKNAIALLITVMFVIVITVAIGVGLQQVNRATEIVKSENFTYQTVIITEDILHILQTNQEIQRVLDSNSSSDLSLLLSQTAFIPFEINGLEIMMKISSARSRFNPAQIDANNSESIQQFMTSRGVNSEYLSLLIDNISGIKEDNSYNSNIFDEHPYLFRDYIASAKHLEKINNFYTNEYRDNALSKIDFERLFYYSADRNMSIDLNFATSEVWEMMIGCTKERAELLESGMGSYMEMADLDLEEQERERLSHFKVSYFEPILFVDLQISQNSNEARVTFEYDIAKKRGSNFDYEI